jgi:hypothetical protein
MASTHFLVKQKDQFVAILFIHGYPNGSAAEFSM